MTQNRNDRSIFGVPKRVFTRLSWLVRFGRNEWFDRYVLNAPPTRCKNGRAIAADRETPDLRVRSVTRPLRPSPWRIESVTVVVCETVRVNRVTVSATAKLLGGAAEWRTRPLVCRRTCIGPPLTPRRLKSEKITAETIDNLLSMAVTVLTGRRGKTKRVRW